MCALRRIVVACSLLLVISAGGCALPKKGQLSVEVGAGVVMSANGAVAFSPVSGENIVIIKPKVAYDNKAIHRDEFKPLIEAMSKIDRLYPCCTAHTEDETYEHPDRGAIRTMVRYDDSRRPPESSEIILLNNNPPTGKQKEALAKYEVKHYGETKSSSAMKALNKEIKYGACQMESKDNILKYSFMVKLPKRYTLLSFFVKGIYRYRSTSRIEYEVDASTCNLVTHREFFPDGLKVYDIFGDRMMLLEDCTTYIYKPGTDIYVSGTRRLLLRTFTSGTNKGNKADVIVTRISSDNRKVVCYEDRLRVDIGEARTVGIQAR
jgi:hypothetical protein